MSDAGGRDAGVISTSNDAVSRVASNSGGDHDTAPPPAAVDPPGAGIAEPGTARTGTFPVAAAPRSRPLEVRARRMFEGTNVLVAAKHRVDMEGIDVAEGIEAADCFHILLDGHEILFADGAACENSCLGSAVTGALGQDACREIGTILPDLSGGCAFRPANRHLIADRLGRKLAARHVKNHQGLILAWAWGCPGASGDRLRSRSHDIDAQQKSPCANQPPDASAPWA